MFDSSITFSSFNQAKRTLLNAGYTQVSTRTFSVGNRLVELINVPGSPEVFGVEANRKVSRLQTASYDPEFDVAVKYEVLNSDGNVEKSGEETLYDLGTVDAGSSITYTELAKSLHRAVFGSEIEEGYELAEWAMSSFDVDPTEIASHQALGEFGVVLRSGMVLYCEVIFEIIGGLGYDE